MCKLSEFNGNKRKSMILRFTTKAGDSGLLFDAPKNKIITQINGITKRRASSIGTISLVCIRVRQQPKYQGQLKDEKWGQNGKYP